MSDNTQKAVEMFVAGLVLDPHTQAPIVVLKDESGDVCLPIWIGVAEATSIATALKNLNLPRPMTHDLMFSAFNQVNIDIQRVMITELKDATYYAELILSQGEKAIVLDSRPSDAIAIALRASAPIFVSQQVIDQAKITFNITLPTEAQVSQEISEQAEESGSDKDFKNIDKDKWEEILGGLDPDDFKYKM